MNVKDLKTFQKKMEVIDKNRLARLRDAKNNKYIKGMVENLAAKELRPLALTDMQRMAIHYLTDFMKNYSNSWVAAKLGVSVQDIYKWRNDPYFLKEMDKEITRRRSFIRLAAFRNLHRAIHRGDMKATVVYLKMSGDLKERVEDNIDMTGEKEMSDSDLHQEITRLQLEVANGPSPTSN